MSLRALIVDDEVDAQEVLETLIKRTELNLNVVDKVASIPEAVAAINKFQPDLVFLDVEMPEYSGYEIIDFFDHIDFHIIFVTAYDNYALKAFEINAVDYLLKPINRSKLKAAIEKVEARVEQQREIIHYKKIIAELSKQEEATIVFTEVGIKRVLKVNDIIAIEAEGTYSKIYKIGDDKPVLLSKNIGFIENELPEDHPCFRSHKSWLINKNHILSYSKSKGLIDLENGLVARLSKYKKKEFELFLNS